jgi:oligopeptide transport system substrate-binding protein
MDAFGRMQQIIFDEAVILPEYERTVLFATDPKITGVVRRVFGADPDFTYVKIAEE